MCDFKQGLLKGKRVLIVEEDAHCARELAEICRNIWSAQGVGICFDAETAFEMLSSGQKYDLVIIEVVMAKNRQDGLEVRNCRQQIRSLINKGYEYSGFAFLRRENDVKIEILTQRIHELIKAEHGLELLEKYVGYCNAKYFDSVIGRKEGEEPAVVDTPILILTSQNESVPLLYLHDADFAVLGKPASMLDINEAVMNLLEGSAG